MAKMDWDKARRAGKPALSTADEKEYRNADAAARWLAKAEAEFFGKKKRRRKRRKFNG
jgi:hypothetical protein